MGYTVGFEDRLGANKSVSRVATADSRSALLTEASATYGYQASHMSHVKPNHM